MAESRTPFEIQSGTCFVLYAFDIAQAVDLDAAARLIRERTLRDHIPHQRRAPRYFEYQPPPLRLSQPIEAIELSPGQRTQPMIDLLIYEFGAVTASFSVDLAGGVHELADLSDRLSDNEALLLEATHRVSGLLDTIRSAAVNGALAPMVEDYIIYHVRKLAGDPPPDGIARAWRHEIAQILRSERQPLSDQEVDDALDSRIAFGLNDLTIIDWQSAMVIDPSAEDVRAVLEFINVELLELRYLDDQLDRVLDRAYKALHARHWRDWLLLHARHRELRELARLQIDAALVFEEVNNALKLFGDQFLARVHRMASRRLHISDWDEAVIRKLDTIDSIYQKISDRQSTRRMEVLEWIIIVLIAISIVIAFLPGK